MKYAIKTSMVAGMVVVPGAAHTDLYDQLDKIPFDNIQKFFDYYLNQQ